MAETCFGPAADMWRRSPTSRWQPFNLTRMKNRRTQRSITAQKRSRPGQGTTRPTDSTLHYEHSSQTEFQEQAQLKTGRDELRRVPAGLEVTSSPCVRLTSNYIGSNDFGK
jgi:hypothetical protein